MVLSLLRAGDHHIDVPAPVLRAPQPVAPIGNRRLYTVPPRGEVRLGLMPAILAPEINRTRAAAAFGASSAGQSRISPLSVGFSWYGSLPRPIAPGPDTAPPSSPYPTAGILDPGQILLYAVCRAAAALALRRGAGSARGAKKATTPTRRPSNG